MDHIVELKKKHKCVFVILLLSEAENNMKNYADRVGG